MLIKITNFCSLGCSHCMENSTIKGEHMTEDAFRRALDFTERVEGLAYQIGLPRRLLLSGGECSEHPEFLKFLDLADQRKFSLFLITNGMWLSNKKIRDRVLARQQPIFVQVTNDKRFYPKKPPVFKDPRVVYVDELTVMMGLGRANGPDGKIRLNMLNKGVPPRTYPASFNLRSLVRHLNSFELALVELRRRAVLGSSGNCIPSISSDGTVVAGESNLCYPVGTIDSTAQEITDRILSMGSCNRCHLEDNLSPEQKRGIGLELSNASAHHGRAVSFGNGLQDIGAEAARDFDQGRSPPEAQQEANRFSALAIVLYRIISSENWRGPRPSGRGRASLKDCP